MRGGKTLQKVALTQGAFCVASGVWPLIDIIYLADAVVEPGLAACWVGSRRQP